jgi:ElaB/YqjD/DUF883 family membrane-anchored ribosome-binding protein
MDFDMNRVEDFLRSTAPAPTEADGTVLTIVRRAVAILRDPTAKVSEADRPKLAEAADAADRILRSLADPSLYNSSAARSRVKKAMAQLRALKVETALMAQVGHAVGALVGAAEGYLGERPRKAAAPATPQTGVRDDQDIVETTRSSALRDADVIKVVRGMQGQSNHAIAHALYEAAFASMRYEDLARAQVYGRAAEALFLKEIEQTKSKARRGECAGDLARLCFHVFGERARAKQWNEKALNNPETPTFTRLEAQHLASRLEDQ